MSEVIFSCHNCIRQLVRANNRTVVNCQDCGWVHMFTTDSADTTQMIQRNRVEITNFDRERGWLWYNNRKYRIPNGCTHMYFAVMQQEKVNDDNKNTL